MFTKERLLFLKIILFLIYMECIILYILFNDIYYSSFFDVSNLNLNFFELQIEIDNFLYLIFSFFFDLNKSIFLYQFIILYIFIRKNIVLKIKNFNIIIFFLSLFIFFY